MSTKTYDFVKLLLTRTVGVRELYWLLKQYSFFHQSVALGVIQVLRHPTMGEGGVSQMLIFADWEGVGVADFLIFSDDEKLCKNFESIASFQNFPK